MQAYVLFVCPGRLKLFLALDIFDVAADHQGDLEGQGVIETADVQAGLLFQFFNPVDQGVSVDEEFAGCLGYIEVILKESADGGRYFRIKGRGFILSEDLPDEDPAEVPGQLIDQSADAQAVVGNDGFIRIEDPVP